MDSGWYFTAPWQQVPVRRGDALGFRAGADYFAELLAPGLSNSTTDARWISLLSWCLEWSQVAWRNSGGGDLTRRDDQQARYAWLRPLELLWVARTLKTGQVTGQLRGRRSIKRWFNAGERPPNFAMSPDQFRRYRQVGMYGAYRVVFRTLPRLTTGDGWTPADTALKLASLVNDSLPHAAQLKREIFENGTKWGHWSGGGEARYWMERGWQAWAETSDFLPTPDDAASKLLPEEECRLLKPALFGAKSIRRVTAEVLASANEASSHQDLCRELANSRDLAKELGPGALAQLPAFSRFADTAMHTMRALWSEINSDVIEQAPNIEKLSRSEDLRTQFDLLREAGNEWLLASDRNVFPYDRVVTQLAVAMRDATKRPDQLRALARHHYQYGGGRHWFREQAGKLVPLVKDTGIAASDYRFRLMPLSRLASQCGVARMNHVLDLVAHNDLDDFERREPDDEEADAL